jgi:hypothetical protein
MAFTPSSNAEVPSADVDGAAHNNVAASVIPKRAVVPFAT